MNGLTLRINSSSSTKNKTLNKFHPITLPSTVILGENYSPYQDFSSASTVDDQLEILKKLFYSGTVKYDSELTKFLAIIFLQAEVKHPVKCFLTRHITKHDSIQDLFSNTLSLYIREYISNRRSEYQEYMDIVFKISTCIENFPAGSAAVMLVEVELAEYLKDCLECCVSTLRNTSLSPTEKNEVFNLTHLSLRLLLYIIQKVSRENTNILISMFDSLKTSIKDVFFDEDAPMDTKTISGIFYLSMDILENGSDAWIKILDRNQCDSYVESLLNNESALLALYSAIATVVSPEMLQSHTINQKPALICLVQHIIAIGERSSSESIFTLGVTRTVLQISKMLGRISDYCLGKQLVDQILIFIWGHLEHYMDSVRHLTAQALSHVVRYCTRIEKEDNSEALNQLFRALNSLDRSRKSFYVSICALTTQLGVTRVIQLLPNIIDDVIGALQIQAVQASATTALETLLQKHARQSNSKSLYEQWIMSILRYVGANTLDSSVLNILENLMATAVSLDENIINYILPHIKESCEEPSTHGNLKSILLLLSVAQKSGFINNIAAESKAGEWKGVISYKMLKIAAVDAVEETRILSLSLVCESPKTTEVFSAGDLDFVLWYLRYNINVQSPNFRQLTLSLMKKFTKRLEDSYKVLKRQKELNCGGDKGDYYLQFVERLRAQCFHSLLPGANYSRRFVALQVLSWADDMLMDGYQREWTEDYVDRLLLHLEDSYESNKALALRILDRCPAEMVQNKKYRISLDIEDILLQASSMKPTDCISAAYKLMLLQKKLPEYILQGGHSATPEAVSYCLLRTLLRRARTQLATCERSVVAAARDAPMYGVLHCMGHVLQFVDHSAISADQEWKRLVEEIIETCIAVNASVSCVVNNSSPEGHLPMDAGGVAVHDYGNTGDVRLEDGRPVTAQMVLLCAWRSVKEVSLLLGTISSRLSIAGEGQPAGTLSQAQLTVIGEHFTSLLAETKHRGAFEQAYVGFTKLLARLWRCRSPSLHGQPREWLHQLAKAVAEPQASATRRSAGLPFMIQALVTTELQVQGNPKCLHEIMTTLLKLAQRRSASQQSLIDIGLRTKEPSGTQDVKTPMTEESLLESRTHSLNILRALFRNSALEESVSGYVGEGLIVALRGFEGDTWMERNSATLLFSALMVRIFGVWRPRAADRNRMTGRIFFLRYPKLYDFIREKLCSAGSGVERDVRPGLYPALSVLARLYPSAVDGAQSALRLAALLPALAPAARAAPRPARALAAAAGRALLAPQRYVLHIESMLSILSDPAIPRNYCDGILLQLTNLMASPPDDLEIEEGANSRIVATLKTTYWILDQGVREAPCYVIVDEYVKMINLIIWRFPSLIEPGMLETIRGYLEQILFTKTIPLITSGREICLSNVIYLLIVILNKTSSSDDIIEVIFKGLGHTCYDVVLSSLNYLLVLYKNGDVDKCLFLEHLSCIQNENILGDLRKSERYIPNLCDVIGRNKYLECVQKSLKILSLERDTQKHIIAMKIKKDPSDICDEEILRELFDCIESEHENVTHVYLESLSNFVSDKLAKSSLSDSSILEVVRVIFACSSSENSDSLRSIVAEFLERNFALLMRYNLKHLDDREKFEFKSTLLATTVTTLEDDEEAIRQRVSDVISRYADVTAAIPTRAGEVLRDTIAASGAEAVALLALVALLDFRSEVCITDEINDECRVFDQNERYNIFLEETIWTTECASKIVDLCKDNSDILSFVQSVIENPVFETSFEKLCNNNVVVFKQMIADPDLNERNQLLNPKIELFVRRLLQV